MAVGMKRFVLNVCRFFQNRWRRVSAHLPLFRHNPKKDLNAADDDIRWYPESEDAVTRYCRKNRRFSLTSRAAWYAVLMVASLLFTQLLRSSASHLFFWFVVWMIPALFFYTWIAKHVLRVSLQESMRHEVEKLSEFDYGFVITNSSFLAFPFVDAVVSLPRADAVRTENRLVRLSMAPLSSYHVSDTVKFRFRGTYHVGVRAFYVYDFFRLFRWRVDVDCMEDVYVMPRKCSEQKSNAYAVADITTRTVTSPYIYERLEISDIRDYRMGDSLKNIHWKLSSKSEEPVVRDYSGGVSDCVVVYCDMAAHFPTIPPRTNGAGGENEKSGAVEKNKIREKSESKMPKGPHPQDTDMKTIATENPAIRAISDEEIMSKSRRHLRAAMRKKPKKAADALSLSDEKKDTVGAVDEIGESSLSLASDAYYDDINEYCADGVVELTVSVVLQELRSGNHCCLVWFDSRVEGDVVALDLADEHDFDRMFRFFATAPLCRPEQKVSRLRMLIKDTQSVKQIFVIPAPDEQTVTEFSHMSDLGGDRLGAVELLCYEPKDRWKYRERRQTFLENCRELLRAKGILLHSSYGVGAPDQAAQTKKGESV